MVDAGIYQYAGPEVAVASTKAFTSQATILLMLSLFFGKHSKPELKRQIQYIRQLPELITKCISMNIAPCKKLGNVLVMGTFFNFLGRQVLYPVALEGSLKLKELAYVHSHGYPAGELKHGPLATISHEGYTIYLAGQHDLIDKNISNMKEIVSRRGQIILIKQQSQEFPKDLIQDDDWVLNIPDCPEELLPILTTIPLQLFALYSAQVRKFNVDKPRNLAKSVTVE
jgi:glucosamine--fructose-6-phosphate aminotransferase (isomerizing)